MGDRKQRKGVDKGMFEGRPQGCTDGLKQKSRAFGTPDCFDQGF